MFYSVICLDPIELEEQIPRWGESEKRVVVITPLALQKEATLAFCVTAASVQGAPCTGRVCIADLVNRPMRKKDLLEMAAGRAVTSVDLRFL